MVETVNQIIIRMPGWAATSDLDIAPLSGGISNQNYRVNACGESFVVRVCGKDTELLGVDRNNEHACNVLAAETGVAPEVVAFFPDLGSIVTRFIKGRKLPAETIATPDNLPRVASSIRRLHAARPFPAEFSPFRAAESYRATAARLVAKLPAGGDTYFDQLDATEAAMYGTSRKSVVLRTCHNDLLNENFLDDGIVRIIDYEYAGMGDPYFDLGNFAAHHELNDDQVRQFAADYFAPDISDPADTPDPESAFARIKLMMMVSDLREALWGTVQTRLSTLDFDYKAYADKHFDRYASASSDRRVRAWRAQAHGTRK